MKTNFAAEQAATTRIPIVLTIKDAVKRIKEECPGTAISEHYIRQLIRDGVLPNLKAGNKQLINLDVLIEYLTDPAAEKFQQKEKNKMPVGGIRPVAVRR